MGVLAAGPKWCRQFPPFLAATAHGLYYQLKQDCCSTGLCLLCPIHNPGLAFKKGDTEDSTRDVRTSSGTFLSRGEDPAGVLAYIEVRGAGQAEKRCHGIG